MTVTPEALTPYLRDRWPERRDLRVTETKRAVGGMSRETWFLTLTDADAAPWTVTLRTDHGGGSPNPVDLEFEFQVYRALAGSRVPVPPALWFEADPTPLGRPFYLREMLPGRSAPKNLLSADQPELRRSIGEQFARLLAAVHTTDWRALGFADFMTVPPAGTGCARVEVDRWARFRRDNAAEPRPVVTELLRWLDSHAPDVPEVCLTWGDVGLGNFVVDDGRIVGLTDWEYAHLGDPMQDWAAAFLRGMDHLLPRDELFAIYEAESGIRVDEDRIRYHTVLVNTQYSVLTDPTLRHILDADGDHDISQVRATMGFLYACQRDAWVIVDTWP